MTILGAADLIMVGALGTAAIAAVSIFLPLRLILLTFSRSLASALTIVTANKFGAGEHASIKVLLRQGFVVSFVGMGLLHIIFFAAFEELVLLMGAQADYLGMALDYGRIAVLSVFISSLSLTLQAILLGLGKTSPIMKSNVIGNLVNIAGNFFLITGFGPVPALGVRGAAIATVLGATVTLGITIWIMHYEKFFSAGFWQAPDKRFWKDFLPVFGGVFSELGAERIGMLFYARMTADLGTLAYAVHSICYNICDFSYDFSFGFGKANMVLAGQARGAGRLQDWRVYRNLGIKWGLVLATIFCCIMYFGQVPIFSIYSHEPEALALSGTVMFWVAIICYPQVNTIITAGILRGSGHTSTVAAYSFVLITILRPLFTAAFIYYFEFELLGAWLAMLCDQSLRTLCFTYKVSRIKSLADMHS